MPLNKLQKMGYESLQEWVDTRSEGLIGEDYKSFRDKLSTIEWKLNRDLRDIKSVSKIVGNRLYMFEVGTPIAVRYYDLRFVDKDYVWHDTFRYCRKSLKTYDSSLHIEIVDGRFMTHEEATKLNKKSQKHYDINLCKDSIVEGILLTPCHELRKLSLEDWLNFLDKLQEVGVEIEYRYSLDFLKKCRGYVNDNR